MTRTTFARLVVAVIGLVAVVGMLDAIGRSQADLAAVLAIILLLAVVLLVHSIVGRRDVPVRRDLVAWMADRAAVEGEEVASVADRAIAAFRSGFLDDVIDLDERVGAEVVKEAADDRRQ